MILVRTPFRVSFFGGGTDYPIWYNEHGGMVVSTAIDQYGYIMVKEPLSLYDYKYEFRYHKVELLQYRYLTQHPSIKETLKYMEKTYDFTPERLTIIYNADVPAMAGLGSSSSFTVGLLNALHALMGRIMDPETLAKDAITIEQDWIKESVGSQDQIIAAYGGIRRIEFYPSDLGWAVTNISISSESKQKLEDNCQLIFTKFQRQASNIAKKQIEATHKQQRVIEDLGRMAYYGYELLTAKDIDIYNLGQLMEESWYCKQTITDSITTPEIEDMYDGLQDNGMIGGKLCGAGSGGFILAIVDPNERDKFNEYTKDMAKMPLRLASGGSRVLTYKTPEGNNGY
jgi:D-glycero-alpha-D-manno-heptose-7-phosphate kinase